MNLRGLHLCVRTLDWLLWSLVRVGAAGMETSLSISELVFDQIHSVTTCRLRKSKIHVTENWSRECHILPPQQFLSIYWSMAEIPKFGRGMVEHCVAAVWKLAVCVRGSFGPKSEDWSICLKIAVSNHSKSLYCSASMHCCLEAIFLTQVQLEHSYKVAQVGFQYPFAFVENKRPKLVRPKIGRLLYVREGKRVRFINWRAGSPATASAAEANSQCSAEANGVLCRRCFANNKRTPSVLPLRTFCM